MGCASVPSSAHARPAGGLCMLRLPRASQTPTLTWCLTSRARSFAEPLRAPHLGSAAREQAPAPRGCRALRRERRVPRRRCGARTCRARGRACGRWRWTRAPRTPPLPRATTSSSSTPTGSSPSLVRRARRAPPRAGRGRQGIAGACGRLAPGRLTGAVYGRGGRAGGGCAPTAASAGERGRPHGMTASDCMRVCNLCGSARLRQGLQLCTCLLCVCNDDRTPISNRGGRSDEGVRQAASGRRTGAWRRTRWTRHVRAAASAPAGPAAPPSCRRA